MKKIIIDLMGADGGPQPLIEGARRTAETHPDFTFVLVGDSAEIPTEVSSMSNIEVIESTDVILASEAPTVIFNGRDDASMTKALTALKDDPDTVGLLSAGNTGALLVGSSFRLGLIKGLKVPALASNLLTGEGEWFCLLDCGANVNCEAKDLARFALLGNAFAKAMYQNENPRVALLSVGRESGKGNALTQEAFPLLKELPINFLGNCEGYDALAGYAEVIVADGYAGNLLLKTIESAGKTAMSFVEKEMASATDETTKSCLRHIFEQQDRMFNLNIHGGAFFLGTKKPVIKMHGCAVADTVEACTNQLIRLVDGGFDQLLVDAIDNGTAE